jgi:acyl-CoA thioester hydrolase
MTAHPESAAKAAPHRHTLRVYYEDTDAAGVVYYANYLRFAERARTEALRALGIPHAEMVDRFGLMFVVRRVEVDYLRPARIDDSLTVVTEALAIGGASVVLRQDVQGTAGSCAVLRVRLACVKPGEEKPARLPPPWRQVLEAMLAERPASVESDTRPA